ncbi:MAG: APC family permease [Corynebacterium sp.]|uniref:APC family permease n=1 Tax=Corynebacterium sp. TaxID=1720 RepID=UPI00185552F3|nr:APC family permease [Corynebacterium sp.]NWO17032.1 APC family permease [Corynebacterium sp.]
MNPTTTTPHAVANTKALRANRLGALAIAFFVIAAAAPIAAVAGASPVLFSAVGAATPLIYLFAALLIALFSIGYLRMAEEVSSAAGFVAYIAKGLGSRIAAGAAGIVLITYLSLQSGLWAQFGTFAQHLFTSLLGIEVPVYALIVIALALTTFLTMLGVDSSLKVLGVIILGETLVILILVVSLIANYSFGIFSFRAFTAETIFGPGLGIALLFAFTCFTSFEATVVFSEEAINPRRTIPRALYLVIAFVGTFYGVSTWAISGAIGNDQIQAAASANPSGIIFDLAATSAGNWLSIAIQILVVTSFIAMLLGLSNMFARYLYALGRSRILPQFLSSTNAKGAPANAAFSNGVLVLLIVSTFLAFGADPIEIIYSWLVALGTAGFVLILILASIAIVVYFARKNADGNPVATKIAPAVSCLAFLSIGYLTITNYDALLGGAGGIAKWLLLLLPVSFLIGLSLSTRHTSENQFEYLGV